MARGLLMLLPLLMLTMGTTMAMVLLTMDMDMVLPTTDMPVPTPMATMDTTARGLLMLPPLLMLTMVPTAMVWPTTDMDTMDTMVIPTLTDSTDIINLFIFVKN